MRYTPTDTTPWMADEHPGANRLDGFDCELPKEARSELQRPKRAAFLRRPLYQPPVSDRTDALKLVGAFALAAIILAAVVTHYSSQQPPGTPKPDPVPGTTAPSWVDP